MEANLQHCSFFNHSYFDKLTAGKFSAILLGMKKYFIIFLVFLFTACPAPKKSIKSDLIDEWMGVYLQKEKIGYSFSQMQRADNYFKMTHRFKIKLTMMDNIEEVISNFICFTDTNFILTKFEFGFQSKKNSFNALGEVKQNKLLIEVKSGGSIKSSTQNLDGPVIPVVALSNLAIEKNFVLGKEYNIKVFDATVLKVIDTKVKVLGKEKLNIIGKDYNLTKMTVSMLGLTTTMWIDNNGVERKEESPPSMTIMEETREQALVQEEAMGKLDIISMFSIPIDTIISNPRIIRYLKVQITGADFTSLNLVDNTQTILQNSPLTLVINNPDSLPKIKLPISGGEEFLKPTLSIQSDNVELKEQASKIVDKEKDGAQAVQKIMNWVFTNVSKRATASYPSALDVLKNREGDCNEHAVLFAALCRAEGIPCQICVGLVYVDGRFYYHAWNKVFLGDWIGVDPTFGQFPVDATHIKFAEGELEEQVKVLKIVGEVRIKVLEFK